MIYGVSRLLLAFLAALSSATCLARSAAAPVFSTDAPVLGAPILFVARPQYKADHHNTETMFQKGEINEASFEGGSALKVIDFARGGEVRTLLDCPAGIIRDPEVHFDGSRVVFSMRHNRDDAYHIYEIGADGSALKQLTFSAGVTDIDPMYLPDDSIVFSSTREPKYCMCNRHIMANLYRMEADGSGIHQIGKNPLFEGHPALLPDGRIVYDRWEYVDRNFGDAQGLWTVNPDGTNHAVYYGNNTWSPGAVLDPRPVPGTELLVCTFSSCHDRPWGAIALIDRRLGVDGRPPVLRTWPGGAMDLIHETGVGTGEDYGFDRFTKVNPKYEDPYPLSDTQFLCARMTGEGETMGLYLLDAANEDRLLYREPAPQGCYDPMPLAPRLRPAVIPSRRNFEDSGGQFYVLDVYRGTHMQGVQRGAVKFLRVVETPEKRNWTPASWNGQGQHAPAMNWHDFNNKRILGTVPVEEDGSAYFTVPSGAFVYFQLLDADGMMIQSMRSGAMIQPGERTGCVGCHENRRSAPPVSADKSAQALRRPPSELTGWYGPPRLFSYVHEVQPVFDRYCVKCHDFGQKAGAKLLLAGDRTETFNVSYNELWRKKLIKALGAGPAETQGAYSWGSRGSRLLEVLRKGHQEVQLDPESLDRLITWIDINAPYYPRYESVHPDNLAGRCPLANDQLGRLAELTSVPFNKLADANINQGPQISFDRPELSPCLDKLRGEFPGRFREALEIIQAGQAANAQYPRDDAGDFAPCPVDAARENRYTQRSAVEINVRDAIRRGERVYDTSSSTSTSSQ